jgi:Xaa-Pro aminopeptidase
MRYAPIDNTLFVENRKRLAAHLKPKSLAVFNANDVMQIGADGTLPFKQHSDIFYFSGVDQEETILVVFPEHPDPKKREVLFVRETSEHIAIWEGHKLTKEEATAVSGIETIFWTHEFHREFRLMAFLADNIYLNLNEHTRHDYEQGFVNRDDRFRKWCMEQFPLHKYERLAPALHLIRSVKSNTEVALIQHACNITEKGFRRLLGFVKPGVWEYEIEAELMHEFLRNRSMGFAYTPIIASGPNACVLHYIENSQQCQDGHVLLLDVAAEYANYNSDLTRAIPVNGRYTPRQKAVYNAVLRVMRQATDMLVVGNNLEDYTREVGQIMEGELIGLGLLHKHEVEKQDPKNPLFRKYFMHGVSHHLGLNVHDYGHRSQTFEEGMVFTCEPGIYIREEGLGIRIENNIVITKNGPVDLMKNIPIEAEEIEDLMNR